MENSSSIEQNLEALARILVALNFCSSRVMEKEPKLLEAKLENIDSAMKDFVELRGEWKKRKGHHSDDSKTHTKLNERVIESLKATTVLKKDVKAIMESMEFRARTETSLTKANGGNHKLEVATPLREVIETSGVKTEKPIIFMPADLTNFTMNFSNKIGADYIGEVFKGHFPPGEIAVTVLADDNVIEETLFVAEVNIMFRTSHPNLDKLYGFCYHQNIKALVYEYMPKSLDNILYQNYQSLIGWGQLHKTAVQTALGLSYLHDGCDVQIIHQDFKASNVLLDSNFSPKIRHYGVAKLINRNKTHTKVTGITEKHCNPVLQKYTSSSEATYKCDIYSFGAMLFEILGRKKNWMDGQWEPYRIWRRYQRGQLDQLIHEWAVGNENKDKAEVMCMVAFWCIQSKEEIRPPMSTVVKMLNMEVPVTTPSNPMPFVPTSTICY